ncbi:sn-glycerol 3-phosphate transport system ATP-binding protein [Tistlia consotensis]|uniref:sn-glycerol 3-phosphate transport system ATP-binding protein n=1 Tax=Tistlia consotensis USBA 355 TaxID=560819 RepID=A0A1Y6B3M0_9PROT|nr:sn-glycerol-3-phosphate ABC transporter ATP-binding protein UgpC [Tistlia consotensis]SME89817.1 sn-glycerol 3-phosphate transport system ATP-binding protein [Tistlia consotensis USBA 355]SNR26335.1 sn-glycerol 3-phosphate transport system ATP-binding protein [Tistlia consotensis]
MAEVRIAGVRKAFGPVEVIHGVDLTIADRQFAVVVGPSGCGKSTLLRMIAGLEETSAGTIHIGQRDVTLAEPKDRNVAMVFQNYALYPHLSVARNIAFGLELRGTPKAEIAARVARAAEILHLDGLLERKPRQLSGGQRQRVAMGRAIVRDPDVFLFDEPLSNLDAKLRVAMRLEIRKLHEALGGTSVYVTHDQIEAMTMGDLLIVMNEGRVEQIGRPMEVYRRPASRFVASFIGSPPMNFLPVEVAGGVARTAADSRIRLDPALNGQAAGPARLVLGLRPEHLAIDAERPALDCLVEVVEPQGADTIVHGRAGEDLLTLRLQGTPEVAVGDRLPLGVAAEHTHLFDAESGRRVG